MAISMKDIQKLSVAERIILAEKIWDSIPENSEELTISAADKKKLDSRIGKLNSGTAKTMSWSELKDKLRVRRK
jgi:putative addiction module component (TIGR02574 family)